MNKKKRIVIVGATSAIAEHCARLWVQDKSVNLTLIGRDQNRLNRVAADLKCRSPHSDICVLEANFLLPHAIQSTVDGVVEKGALDIVLIAHGSLPEQDNCQNNLLACHEALEINGISPVLYAESFAAHLAQANHGTLILIGSVAGDRGRQSNYVYGAAKGLVTRYAQGLQHRFANTNVKIVLVKPGPTDTPMTAHLKGYGAKLAPVADVAKDIIEGIESNKAIVYTPGKWKLIMLIIQHLPMIIFHRMKI